MTGAARQLVYDGDCGLCTRLAGVARRVTRGVEVLPWQQADLAALGLTAAECVEAVRFVERGGPDGEVGTAGPRRWRRYAGAPAIAAALRTGGPLSRLVGGLLTAPGLRRLADVAYRFVARHRHRLPGGTATCAMPPASAAMEPGAEPRAGRVSPR